jgi:hypothetical protein
MIKILMRDKSYVATWQRGYPKTLDKSRDILIIFTSLFTMKKAKFLLAAIAVFAIAGGVYASKAKIGKSVWVRANADINVCNVQVPQRTLVDNGVGAITTTFATDIANDPCPAALPVFTGA